MERNTLNPDAQLFLRAANRPATALQTGVQGRCSGEAAFSEKAMSVDTLYGVLGLAENASSADIKTAYRNLIKQVHPDTLLRSRPIFAALPKTALKK